MSRVRLTGTVGGMSSFGEARYRAAAFELRGHTASAISPKKKGG